MTTPLLTPKELFDLYKNENKYLGFHYVGEEMFKAIIESRDKEVLGKVISIIEEMINSSGVLYDRISALQELKHKLLTPQILIDEKALG